MKFGYSFKTSDGVRHEKETTARCREDVFSALRADGIRPIKVWEIRSPYSVSKRTTTIIVLVVALGFALYALKKERTEGAVARRGGQVLQSDCVVDPLPRKYIAGGGATNVHCRFENKADAFLSCFACPAVKIADDSRNRISDAEVIASVESALKEPIRIFADDSPNDVLLKRMVWGVKREASEIRATGRTTAEVLRYFADRQDMECAHRMRVLQQLNDGVLSVKSVKDMFDTMGFPPVADNHLKTAKGVVEHRQVQ